MDKQKVYDFIRANPGAITKAIRRAYPIARLMPRPVRRAGCFQSGISVISVGLISKEGANRPGTFNHVR
jgi:hypothetical protein